MDVTRLERNELACLGALVASAAGFAWYGLATRASGTVGYLFTVGAVGAVIVALRRTSITPPLTLALTLLAVAHLAGGLVQVGDGVLYNASFATPVLQYDHLVHVSGVLIGTLVLWSLFVPPADPLHRRRDLVAISVLAGLGLGAVNELIEFLTTLVDAGSQVGGYTNTGWDLASNMLGAGAAGLWLRKPRSAAGVRHPVRGLAA